MVLICSCTTCKIMANSTLPHIAIFPFMAKGHTIPLLHLAHLIHHRNLATLTFFTTPLNAPFLRRSLADTKAAVVELPFPQDIPNLPKGVESTDLLPSMKQHFLPFLLATKELRQHFEQALETLPTVNFLISDGFLGWTNESAAKFSIPRLAFYGTGNFATVLLAYIHRDRPFSTGVETYSVPGFSNIIVSKGELPTHVGSLHDFLKEQMKATCESNGLLVNSFYELEHIYYDYWNTNFKVKSWCIGPVCLASKQEQPAIEKPDWLMWLDSRSVLKRPVLYVAFGSQAEVSEQQLAEISLGLEMSGLDFLWVVRGKGFGFLEEFEDRVGERGKVVREWVDQLAVLRHGNVKGFVSHCGWNSVLEGISAGVPILAWPKVAEQHLNAKLVVEELGVALRIEVSKDSHDGLVSGRDVEMAVKRLILGEEGKKAAEKVSTLADAARRAMNVGGSSWRTLEKMIDETCCIGEILKML